MVDRADLSRVNDIYAELNQMDAALANLAEGGMITTMTIAPGPSENMRPMGPRPATITTAGMTYPPTMVDAIKTALEGRRHGLEQELEQLGITGVAEGRR